MGQKGKGIFEDFEVEKEQERERERERDKYSEAKWRGWMKFAWAVSPLLAVRITQRFNHEIVKFYFFSLKKT